MASSDNTVHDGHKNPLMHDLPSDSDSEKSHLYGGVDNHRLQEENYSYDIRESRKAGGVLRL